MDSNELSNRSDAESDSQILKSANFSSAAIERDLAALANSGGGTIVIDTTKASAPKDVNPTTVANRIWQAAARIAPSPQLSVETDEGPNGTRVVATVTTDQHSLYVTGQGLIPVRLSGTTANASRNYLTSPPDAAAHTRVEQLATAIDRQTQLIEQQSAQIARLKKSASIWTQIAIMLAGVVLGAAISLALALSL